MEKSLELKNLFVKVAGKDILSDVNLKIKAGEVCVLMGPNGAGKSTISNVIMGNPKYEVVSGDIILDGEVITNLKTNERAKKGLFMSFQHPSEISGVTMANFLRTSYNIMHEKKLNVGQFHKLLKEKMLDLNMDGKFRSRFVNAGFSGGEKKRSEILQLVLFEPSFAILDEIDSGLDVDALKLVAKNINILKTKNNMGIIIITHYNKILDYLKADKVFVLKNGKIVREGGACLAKEIEVSGFNK
ncbi:MAG: Fe-S cluster assembly ATPase SufC [Nanoarchaeota archaeon]|nr:Fe-S cluster assembly ATPase SufC [Nanoarchaeota archaeon]